MELTPLLRGACGLMSCELELFRLSLGRLMRSWSAVRVLLGSEIFTNFTCISCAARSFLFISALQFYRLIQFIGGDSALSDISFQFGNMICTVML